MANNKTKTGSTMILAKDIMTKNVISIKESMPIYEALMLLSKHKISGMPVVDDDNRVEGVLSEKDVLKIMVDSHLPARSVVGDYMSRDVITFKEDDNVVTICKFFMNSHIRRVPITRNQLLVGILSRRDIVQAIIEMRSKMDALRLA